MKADAEHNEDETSDETHDESPSQTDVPPHEEEVGEETLSKEAIENMTRGMVYASLAITDDKEGTLKKIGKANPWQKQAVKMVTGCKETAYKPLTEILEEMNLKLDNIIDISGVTKGGHFLDTQGYIAHNDTTIVLAYRCTTSAFDWLTNFNTTSSAWEVEEDAEQGYSGMCSGFDDFCCTGGDYKPRVHTGFYNNFLASLPHIKEHVEPLLGENEPPRKLFVVGHSLGGGVATVAACYFLLGFDWPNLPHKFVCVTAGAPRSCATSMKTCMDERMELIGKSAKMYRLVKDRDIVPKVPPTFLSFQHLCPPVSIDEDGTIIVQEPTFVDTDGDADKEEVNNMVVSAPPVEEEEAAGEATEESEKTKYEKWIGRVPRGLRDHMPEFYLKPLFAAQGISTGVELEQQTTVSPVEPKSLSQTPSPVVEEKSKMSKKSAQPRKGLFGRMLSRKRSVRKKQ